MRKALSAVLVCAPIWLIPVSGSAQVRSDPRGFHAGLYASVSSVTYEGSGKAEVGGGFGATLGWGVTNRLTLYAEGSAAQVEMLDGSDTYMLGHFDLGARANFRAPQRRWRPWATVGVSGRAAQGDVGGYVATLRGAGFTFGGGVAYFVSRRLAVDLGYKWTMGDFTDAEVSGVAVDIDPVKANSDRLNLGVAYWLGGR